MTRVSFLPPRIFVLLCGCLVYASAIIIGLGVIQLVRSEHYTVLAEQQHWRRESVAPQRGRIMSSDGYVLATNEPGYSVSVEVEKVPDRAHAARQFREIVGVERIERLMPREETPLPDEGGSDAKEEPTQEEREKAADAFIEGRLSTTSRWVLLFRKVTDADKRAMMKAEIPGLVFSDEPRRLYPEGKLAAHILGFIGFDRYGEDKGYFGIEGYYDGDLRGEAGTIAEERTARGEPILIGEYTRIDPAEGSNITLTLDRTVQSIVEQHLTKAVDAFDTVSGSVVVLDPLTGAVRAMVNMPTFDPNDPLAPDPKIPDNPDLTEHARERMILNRRNIALSTTYEPGSVIKPLTVASALEEKVITPESTFADNGPIEGSGFYVDNWDRKHHGTITPADILALSNNVGSAQVGMKLGAFRLHSYLRSFGLGSVTMVDLEGEDTGVLKDPTHWKDIDTMTAAFGQGFSATPLQLATAFSPFANGGVLMRPYVVEKVEQGNAVREFHPEEVRRVISVETASRMQEMLVKAVAAGESRYYNIQDHTIAGKTGTAQIAINGKYDATLTNTTFIGFLPKDPRFVMVVKLEKPTSSVYAAETAVPLWMDITRELITYYGIPADK